MLPTSGDRESALICVARQRPPLRRPGFSLLEALVALTILGLFLTVGMAWRWQEPGLRQNLQARQALLDGMESTLASLRAGVIELAEGPVDLAAAAPDWPWRRAPEVWLDLHPTDTPGLCRVRVRGRLRERPVPPLLLESLVWRPQASCGP